ncbi:MAG: glutamine--tRNA ligase/YqeY domain fusion protein, partial [Acidobacteriota bacterium]
MSDRPLPSDASADDAPRDFLRDLVTADVQAGTHAGRVVTRFPPEPNGYPHIGHAKSIVLNFGVAEQFGGACHLRFDDTNPTTEDPEYVTAIERDVRWLGFAWHGSTRFASDYFGRLYDCALRLIRSGKAYVCSLSEEEIRQHRGTVTEPGTPSPYRARSVEENLALFAAMREGAFEEGAHVLRARIDMASPNMKLRDPLLYRIRKAHHYRTGDAWPIYPMYDFAHPLSDAFEGITHSFCTLEFENNRALYDWVIAHAWEQPAALGAAPGQTEFARLRLSYTVLSKRKLLALVDEGHVDGWDDPRMPTLSGLRRRGVPPRAIRQLCEQVGVAKANSTVDIARFEHAIRDVLNPEAPRVLCVLDPLEVVLENLPADHRETFDAPLYPRDIGKAGMRALPFGRRLFIERDDFQETPAKGFRRLAPGRAVRLRHGYVVRCVGVEHDPASGAVTRLRCVCDTDSLAGPPTDGVKVHGTIHWVAADDAVAVAVRLYDRLFTAEQPDRGKLGEDFRTFLNPASLTEVVGQLEPAAPALAEAGPVQFERQGYFAADRPSSDAPSATDADGRQVFNRVVTLRDTWAGRAAPT